jgi:hypothetical protein
MPAKKPREAAFRPVTVNVTVWVPAASSTVPYCALASPISVGL